MSRISLFLKTVFSTFSPPTDEPTPFSLKVENSEVSVLGPKSGASKDVSSSLNSSW